MICGASVSKTDASLSHSLSVIFCLRADSNAAARPNSNNPMVRLFSNCESINNRGIPGSLGFRARGALSSIDGFFGVAVANPNAFGGLGSIRVYEYTDNRRNEIWSASGDAFRQRIGERAFLVPDVDGDDLPDLIATASIDFEGRGTNLYYSTSPLRPLTIRKMVRVRSG